MAQRPIEERRSELRRRRRGGPGQIVVALLVWAASGLLILLLVVRGLTDRQYGLARSVLLTGPIQRRSRRSDVRSPSATGHAESGDGRGGGTLLEPPHRPDWPGGGDTSSGPG